MSLLLQIFHWQVSHKNCYNLFVVCLIEITYADGVKSNVVYFVDKKAAEASLSVSSFKPAGRDLNVTAIYKTSGDQFILKETWTIDKNNKVSGQYNFSNEEAVFGYDVSRSGVTVSGTYNILKESPTLAIKKNASPNTYAASFGMKDKSVALTWNHTSDLKYAIRLTGKMSRRLLESPALTVIATKEFLL